MLPTILSEIDIPSLDEAVRARGYALEIGVAGTIPPDRLAATIRRWHAGLAVPRGPVPQIAVTACSGGVVAALDAGAADAVAAPVDPVELAARIDARVRTRSGVPLELGSLTIDPVARNATRGGQAIALLPREYALLRCLADRAGCFVSRRELLERVWGLRFDPGTNVVAVHVSNLRAKLDRPFGVPMLHSARGLGYCLAPV